MKVSIAMCTYNGARYLQEQLDSLATQQRLPDELILCDDGSTDATVALAERFAASAPFAVRIVRNDVNLGYSRNFAKAVSLCAEGVIALCDQDDVWYAGKIAKLIEVFSADATVEGVFSNGDLLDAASQPTGQSLWGSFRFGLTDQARFRGDGAIDALLRRNVVTGMAFAFRSTAAHLLSTTPPTWIHDGWLAFHLALRGTLVALADRLVGYRVHGSQSVGTPFSARDKLRWIQSNGFSSYLRRTRERNYEEYERTSRQFDDLAAHLAEAGLGSALTQQKVRAKADHARRSAAALALRRGQRWGLVLPHLESYARFSPSGLRAIPRDLIL